MVERKTPAVLVEYPYVVVRVCCARCGRDGRYRLARLAAKFGPQARLSAVLLRLTEDCNLRGEHPGKNYCQADYPDIHGSRPPDLPPALVSKLRAIPGGKS